MLWEASVLSSSTSSVLTKLYELDSPSSLYNDDQVTSESSAAWIPYIIVSIMFLISPSCPPGPRPPVKRQDTGLSPNLSFSWSSVSDQEVENRISSEDVLCDPDSSSLGSREEIRNITQASKP